MSLYKSHNPGWHYASVTRASDSGDALPAAVPICRIISILHILRTGRSLCVHTWSHNTIQNPAKCDAYLPYLWTWRQRIGRIEPTSASHFYRLIQYSILIPIDYIFDIALCVMPSLHFIIKRTAATHTIGRPKQSPYILSDGRESVRFCKTKTINSLSILKKWLHSFWTQLRVYVPTFPLHYITTVIIIAVVRQSCYEMLIRIFISGSSCSRRADTIVG